MLWSTSSCFIGYSRQFRVKKYRVLCFFILVILQSISSCFIGQEANANATGDQIITKDQFLAFMSSVEMNPFQAVKDDVDRAIQRIQRMDGVQEEVKPISLLVNRTAFQVMFPSQDEEGKYGVSKADLQLLRDRFFTVAAASKSVVFARAQPAMKKRMVTEVMARMPNAVTLAIGDGANDTEMIQAAHVGIGISGVEGTAATNCADYALGTFRMLHPLIFVHGFWNYHRMANLVVFMFYKAIASALAGNLYMGFKSGWSAQQFYIDTLWQIYNVIFTALPVLFVAVLDKPLPRYTLQNSPVAYREARGRAFRARDFVNWIGRAVRDSIIIYGLPIWFLGESMVFANGQVLDIWFMSAVVLYCAVFVPTIVVMFNMTTVSLVTVLALLSSYSSILVIPWFLNLFLSFDSSLFMVINTMYADPKAWLVMLLTISLPFLIEVAMRAVKNHYSVVIFYSLLGQ